MGAQKNQFHFIFLWYDDDQPVYFTEHHTIFQFLSIQSTRNTRYTITTPEKSESPQVSSSWGEKRSCLLLLNWIETQKKDVFKRKPKKRVCVVVIRFLTFTKKRETKPHSDSTSKSTLNDSTHNSSTQLKNDNLYRKSLHQTGHSAGPKHTYIYLPVLVGFCQKEPSLMWSPVT